MLEFLNLSFHFSPPKSFNFFIKNFFEVLIDVIVLGEIFSLVIQKQSSRQKVALWRHKESQVLQILTRSVDKKSVFKICPGIFSFVCC